MPSDKPSILVRLSNSEKRSVINAAGRDGRSASAWVRQLIRKELGLIGNGNKREER